MHIYHQFNDLGIAGIYDYEPLLPAFDFPESLEGKRVLDIGCATGYFSRLFERKGGEVTACDVNVSAVHHIKKKLGLKLDIVECDVYDLNLGCNFDFIFCGSLLLHTFYPMWLLRIINQHLRPKGTFVLTTHYAEGDNMVIHCYPHLGRPIAKCEKEVMSSYQSLWHPTISAMKNMVSMAGFKEVHCVNTYMLSSTPYGEQIGHGYHTPHCIIRSHKEAEVRMPVQEEQHLSV